MAQLFYGIGAPGLAVCFVASVIYTLKKHRTATGELLMAGFLASSGESFENS